MKRKSLVAVLIIIPACLIAQQRKKQSSDFTRLQATYHTLRALQNLDECYQQIYIESSKWIHSVLNVEKTLLEHSINSKYPAIKLSIDENIKLTSDKLCKDSIDEVIDEIYQQIGYTNQIMNNLRVFEDYVDSIEYRSVKWLGIKDMFVQQMIPLHVVISHKLNRIIVSYRNQVQTMLESLPPNMKKKIDFENIVSTLDYYYNVVDSKKYLNTVFLLTFHWIYLPEDSISKNALQRLVKNGYSLPGNKIIYPGHVGMDKDTLIDLSRHITESLSTPESYEDPITLFMCEDVIESEMGFYLRKIALRLTDMQANAELDLDASITNLNKPKALVKHQDIIKLLDNDRDSFLIMIESLKEKFLKDGNASSYEAIHNLKFEDLYPGIISIYDRLFTHEEIKDILKFRTSSTGKKLQQQNLNLSIETLKYIVGYINKLAAGKQ